MPTKYTEKQEMLLKAIDESNDPSGEAYIETGRYKPFTLTTLKSLEKRGLITFRPVSPGSTAYYAKRTKSKLDEAMEILSKEDDNKPLLVNFRDDDAGCSRNELRAMAKLMGKSETTIIHMALNRMYVALFDAELPEASYEEILAADESEAGSGEGVRKGSLLDILNEQTQEKGAA